MGLQKKQKRNLSEDSNRYGHRASGKDSEDDDNYHDDLDGKIK